MAKKDDSKTRSGERKLIPHPAKQPDSPIIPNKEPVIVIMLLFSCFLIYTM